MSVKTHNNRKQALEQFATWAAIAGVVVFLLGLLFGAAILAGMLLGLLIVYVVALPFFGSLMVGNWLLGHGWPEWVWPVSWGVGIYLQASVMWVAWLYFTSPRGKAWATDLYNRRAPWLGGPRTAQRDEAEA